MQRRLIMKTPKAVWQQDSKYALFILGITLCFFGVPALIALLGFGQPTGKSIYIGFAVASVGSGLLFLFNWLRDRRQAGPVVVDLLPIPARWTAFLLGAMFILMGFVGSFESASLSSGFSWLISSLIGLAIGSYQILFGYSRLEVRKNGIMIYTEFVPWDKIDAFEWAEGDGAFSRLKIQYRTQFLAIARKVDLPVPIEKKQQLELLLAQHVRGQTFGEKHL
jgi:hypothetical protein